MENKLLKNKCPSVPTLYPGTVGQLDKNRENSGTISGTANGTESLKALADKVLQKDKMGQCVGQSVGQSNIKCPKPVGQVGQSEIDNTNGIYNNSNNINNLHTIYGDDNKCPTFYLYGCGTVGQHDFDMNVDRSIFEFNEKLSSNYTMKDIPPGFTHRTLEIEEQFTEAANCGDVERFRELLRQWRGAWLGLMVKRPVTYH